MDKLRVGILGMRRGISHLHNFLAVEEAEVIGVADRLPGPRERAEQIMRDKGNQGRICGEYEELLALQPDALVVASNGRAQCGHAVQALEAGCHVLSEVPGAFSLEEWLQIREAAERAGKQYMMGENLCFMDFIRYWRKWIESGKYGEMSIAEAEYLHYLPNTMTNAQGEFFTPSQVREQGIKDVFPTWRADQPPIGYLTHDLGPILEVLDDRVVTVTCMSAPYRCQEAPLRPDGQIALFHTARGLLVQMLVTLNTIRPGEHRFRLFGTGGSLEWSMYEDFGRRFDSSMEESAGWEVVDIGLAAKDTDPTTGHGGTDINLARQFTRCLLKDGTVPIDVYRSIEYSLPGIIAGQSAALGGMPLAIPDLRREPFVHTNFWNVVGFPEDEPEGKPYKKTQELG